MTPIQPPQPGGDFGEYDEDFHGGSGRRSGRRKLVRYGVPVAIAGVAAATIGLGTALAATGGSPSLPHLTAEQLLTKMAQSRVQTVSGTVQVTTDLGIPAGVLGGTAIPGGSASPLAGAAGQGSNGMGGGSSADPQQKLTELLSGTHTLQVAADGRDRQRISVLDSTSEYSMIHNGNQMWAYDSATNSVYHESRPADAQRTMRQRGMQQHNKQHNQGKQSNQPAHPFPATPQDAAQQALKAVDPTTSVTVDGTARVAGRSAYELLITPKQAGSTIGSIRVAVDAGNGVPLSFTLTPKGSSTPAFDIAYTSVNFGKPAANTFTFTVPKGAKVTEGTPGMAQGHNGQTNHSAMAVLGTGWTTIAELKPMTGTPGGPAGGMPGGMMGGMGGGMMGGMGGGVPGGKATGSKALSGGSSLPSLLSSLGHQVHGSFGSGTLINTRLVNVLITSNGTVYVGAVNDSSLIKAADSTVGK